MLTLICSPKPFVNEAEWNQINALRSWKAIHPEIEIFIFGTSSGAAEAAAEVKAIHVPDILCSSTGAPSFNAMVQHASKFGRYDLQVYINCDILMNSTIITAMQQAHSQFEKFLLIGERLDLINNVMIDVRQSNWVGKLPELVERKQLLVHGPTGADYFGFVRGLWRELPPVFMGRGLCDMALIHYCLRNHIPVIDSTLAVVTVHQFHGYQHVKGEQQEVFHGVDYEEMASEHKLHHSLPTVADANWQYSEARTIKVGDYRGRVLRKFEFWMRYNLGLDRPAMAIRALQYLVGKWYVFNRILPMEKILKSWLVDSL